MSTNDITGDRLVSKQNNDKFRENYERIFGKKDKEKSTDYDFDKLVEDADNGMASGEDLDYGHGWD